MCAPGASQGPQSTTRHRLVLTAAVTAYFIVGFRVVATLASHRPLHTLRTPLDDAIPFLPWTVWIYSWVYTSAFYPFFVVRSHALFRRVALAYTLVFTVAYTCFVLHPVTSVGLRPSVASLDDRTFAGWAMHLTYTVDPPYNLFPSLHLAVALTAALSVWRASRVLGALGLPVVLGIAVTICTTRQHFVADGVGAVILAAAVYHAVLRPEIVWEPGDRTHGARGAVAYLGFHTAVYAGFVAAWFIGLRAG